MAIHFYGALLAAASLAGLLAEDGRTAESAGDFEPPVRLKAGDQYIDVDIGHAAPYMYDFTGNGLRDLLVGQFGQGRLRVYRNVGTRDEPSFENFEYFKAGHEYGTVPAG
jgi:hypothetical protein